MEIFSESVSVRVHTPPRIRYYNVTKRLEEHPFHPISFTFHRKFELFRSNFRRTGFEWNRWKLSIRISTRLARSYLFNSIANYLSIISEEHTFNARVCTSFGILQKQKREQRIENF